MLITLCNKAGCFKKDDFSQPTDIDHIAIHVNAIPRWAGYHQAGQFVSKDDCDANVYHMMLKGPIIRMVICFQKKELVGLKTLISLKGEMIIRRVE